MDGEGEKYRETQVSRTGASCLIVVVLVQAVQYTTQYAQNKPRALWRIRTIQASLSMSANDDGSFVEESNFLQKTCESDSRLQRGSWAFWNREKLYRRTTWSLQFWKSNWYFCASCGFSLISTVKLIAICSLLFQQIFKFNSLIRCYTRPHTFHFPPFHFHTWNLSCWLTI